jgi:hypothetical protein
MVWQTASIVTNIPRKFHSDEHSAAGQFETFSPWALLESV